MMALEMWVAVMFFATWLPSHWKRRVVGFGLISDISVHVVLQTLFGGDAMGRAGMLLAGILINISMHAYRNLYGWESIKRGRWTRFAGRMT
jgi:hypothetical protein